MLNGHLPSLWSGLNYSEITIKDWFDNEISLPKVSSLSLAFSIANMIKAAIHLNIYKTHRTERKFTHQTLSDNMTIFSFFCSTLCSHQMISEGKMHLVGKIFDHLPFWITSGVFRLAMI